MSGGEGGITPRSKMSDWGGGPLGPGGAPTTGGASANGSTGGSNPAPLAGTGSGSAVTGTGGTAAGAKTPATQNEIYAAGLVFAVGVGVGIGMANMIQQILSAYSKIGQTMSAQVAADNKQMSDVTVDPNASAGSGDMLTAQQQIQKYSTQGSIDQQNLSSFMTTSVQPMMGAMQNFMQMASGCLQDLSSLSTKIGS